MLKAAFTISLLPVLYLSVANQGLMRYCIFILIERYLIRSLIKRAQHVLGRVSSCNFIQQRKSYPGSNKPPNQLSHNRTSGRLCTVASYHVSFVLLCWIFRAQPKIGLYLGLCKPENEILKKAKNRSKITFLDRKISFLSVFSHFQTFIF